MTHKGYYIKHGSNWSGPFFTIFQAEKTAELSGYKPDEITWMEGDDERLKPSIEEFLEPASAAVPTCPICGRGRATELEFFKWMFVNLNLGAAHGTVMDMMKECFMNATGKNIPEGWNRGSAGETMDKE